VTKKGQIVNISLRKDTAANRNPDLRHLDFYNTEINYTHNLSKGKYKANLLKKHVGK